MPRKSNDSIQFGTFGEAIDAIGFKEAAKLLGQRGGKSKSNAKAEAARANGKRGGRPPKLKS